MEKTPEALMDEAFIAKATPRGLPFFTAILF